MSKLVLIDGYSLLNRAYYAMPKLTDSKGRPIGAVLGFINILQKIAEDEKPTHIAVAMDEKAPTFRHQRYSEYKGNRKSMDDELRSQIPILKELLVVMKIKTVSKEGFEADDMIGSMAGQLSSSDNQVVIVSGDRDLLQLINENVGMRLARTVKGKSVSQLFSAEDVQNEFGVSPKGIIELKALMGDASDNIPGVKGVGEKTATKLLAEYENIDEIYERIDSVKPDRVRNLLISGKDMAYLSRELATIYCDVPVAESLSELVYHDYYESPDVYQCFQELGFRKQLEKFKLNSDEKIENTELDLSYTKIDKIGRIDEILQNLTNRKLSCYPVFIEKRLKALVFGDESNTYVIEDNEFEQEYLIEMIDKLCSLGERVSVFESKTIAKLFLQSGLSERLFGQDTVYKADKIADLSLFSYLLDSNRGEELSKIDRVLSMLLGTELVSAKEFFDGQKEKDLLLNQAEAYYGYMSGLQKLMVKAADTGKDRLFENNLYTLYCDVEFPLSFVLADMEITGIAADRCMLEGLSSDFEKEIAKLQASIYTEAGEIFNINSPKQLGEVLFDKLKLPSGKKTKTGYSTAADVLEKLKNDYPIVKNILEYRHYSKLKTTYADALPEYILGDGRIHGIFNQTVTSTGRLSSTEPNLQNIPTREENGRLLRKAFVPKEGCIFLDADYSQIELRILAHMSQDERLLSAYSQGEDIHKMTAAAVFRLPLSEVTDRHRSNAKAVNFGIIYGISAFGLSNDIDISMKEAKKFIETYFETFPNIKKFLDNLVEKAKKSGYAKTLFDRRRYIPELQSSNFMRRSFGERIAMNAPIQGTAADIIKLAMIRVYHRFREEGLKAKLVLQVHDELLVEAPLEEKERAYKILKEEMTGAMELSIPLIVDINEGMSWYEAK